MCVQHIDEIFEKMDEDGSGGLDFSEFQARIQDLPTANPIHLIQEDFDQITLGGQLLDENGEFRNSQFQTMIRKELLRFSQRKCTIAMKESTCQQQSAMLMMLKLLEINLSGLVDAFSADRGGHGRAGVDSAVAGDKGSLLPSLLASSDKVPAHEDPHAPSVSIPQTCCAQCPSSTDSARPLQAIIDELRGLKATVNIIERRTRRFADMVRQDGSVARTACASMTGPCSTERRVRREGLGCSFSVAIDEAIQRRRDSSRGELVLSLPPSHTRSETRQESLCASSTQQTTSPRTRTHSVTPRLREQRVSRSQQPQSIDSQNMSLQKEQTDAAGGWEAAGRRTDGSGQGVGERQELDGAANFRTLSIRSNGYAHLVLSHVYLDMCVCCGVAFSVHINRETGIPPSSRHHCSILVLLPSSHFPPPLSVIWQVQQPGASTNGHGLLAR